MKCREVLGLAIFSLASADLGADLVCSDVPSQSLTSLSSFPSVSAYCNAALPPVTVSTTLYLNTTVSVTSSITKNVTNTITDFTTTATTYTITDTETDTATTTATVTTTSTVTASTSTLVNYPVLKRGLAARTAPGDQDFYVTVTSTRTHTTCPCDTTSTSSSSSVWSVWGTTSMLPSSSPSFTLPPYYTNSTYTTGPTTDAPTSTIGSPAGPSFTGTIPTEFPTSLCACIGYPATVTNTLTSTVTGFTTLSQTITADSSTTATDTITTPTTITATATVTTTTTAFSTETDTTTTTSTSTSTCPAASPTVCAGTLCKNLQSDKLNCGTCGNKCATGLICESGTCVQPNECAYSGQVTACYDGNTCGCYNTAENRGFCAALAGNCGQSCNTSDDCPGNNVCITEASEGCSTTGIGNCSLDFDLNTCPNPTTGYKLFAKKNVSEKRDGGHRKGLDE